MPKCAYCPNHVVGWTIVVPARFGYRDGMKVCLKPAVYAQICPDCNKHVHSSGKPVAARSEQMVLAADIYQRLKGANGDQ